MAGRKRPSDIDRLSELMRSQQKSLQCTICLELMKDPTKTRCGHSFCRYCIGKVLQSKDARCPLCNKSLNRRNISRDDDVQIYIEKFNKLVTAIEIDTHIDILWHSKRPYDTKESSSYLNAGQSSQESNKEKPSEKERSACRLRQNANRQSDRPSTSRGTRIDCKGNDKDSDVSIGTFNPPYESGVSVEKTETLSSLSRVLPGDDETHVTPDIKIRTWLHSVPDKSASDAWMTDEENEVPPIGGRAKPTNPISVDNAGKSNEIGEAVYRDRRIDASRRPRRDRKPNADCPKRLVDDEDATSSQVNKGARQIGEVMEIDSDARKLKYSASNARIRAMESREKNTRSQSAINLTAVNQSSSPSSAAHDQEHRAATSTSCPGRASTSAITEQATADWSRVIEFGKEMKRARKRKVKKLNVSTEKTKISPRIIEDIVLSPASRYDSARIVSCNKKSENAANLSNRPESDGRERDAIDKSLDLSDAAKAEASSETNIRMEFVDEDKDEVGSKSCPMMSTSYVTLEEGRQIRIINLNNEQVNKILGLESAAEDSQNRRCREDNAADHRDSPLSRQKRLSVLEKATPEKLNESVHEREIIRDASSQTSVGNFGNSSRLSAEKRPTPGPRETSNVRGTSSGAASPLQFSTPDQSRLSLRRKLEIGSSTSPRLSDLPLSTRLSIGKHEERVEDRRSVDSPVPKDDERFDRLKAVRRDLKFKITHEDQQRTCRDAVPASASKSVIEANDGNVPGIDRQDSEPGRDLTGETSTVPPKKSPPTRSESVAGQERLMKIIRLGSLIREHLPSVRYIYLGTTNRESSIPAKVEISTVYNILQSAGVSVVRAATSDPLNDSQDSCNIVVENTCFVSKDSKGTASKEFPAALPICGASATSTPQKDVDSHLSLQRKSATTVRFLTDASQRTDKSRIVENVAERGARSLPGASSRADKSAIHGSTISHTHSGNSIKLLSPDKDSQLKFLQIDSPSVSEREQLRRASSIKSVIKGNNFPEMKSSRLAASTVGKAREPCVENSGKNRKRMRCAGDRELFEDRSSDGNENSSDLASDSSRTTIKFGRYKELLSKSASWSRLDANKKRRLSPPDDRDVEVIPSTSKKPDAPERKLETSNSDTESKSATHITKSLERHIDHQCVRMQHPSITDNLESDHQCDRMQRKASFTDAAAKEDPAERRSDHQCARMQRNASITDAIAKQGPAERDSEDSHIWNIIDRWTDEHNATAQKGLKEGKNSQSSVKSMRSAAEESSASHQSTRSRNAPPEMEKRKNSKSSQKSSAREPDMFESSSFFDSENVDYILRQSMTRPKVADDTSKRIEDSTNDDIINRVLEIDRSRGNTDACRPPPDSVPRNDITSQREKDNGEHLLQDNFDEIIASIEQPQSEDFIPCTEQPDRNPNRPSAKQKTSNCLAMADESCGVMQQETPIAPPSSTNDMFEHYSPRNITKLPHETTNATARPQDSFISRSSDKENVACSQARHGHAGDQRDGKDAAANVDAIDKDSRKRIASRHNISREKEKTSFEERNTSIQSVGRLRINDADGEAQRATAAGNKSNPKDDTFEHDSLMDITQHQIQLQMFEEDLFGVAAQNQTKTKMISQDDSFRKEQSIPRKRKQNSQDKNTESEERSADEDDVVENTPERKRRNSGNTAKTIESRESTKIAFLSPISRISDRTPGSACQIVRPFMRSDASTPTNSLAMCPQSTPITHNPTIVLNHADVLRASRRSELAENSSGVLLQVDARTLENVRRPPDRRNLRFVCSGLTAAQIATVKEFAAKHNANYVNQFDRDVTHVIVKTVGEQNAAKSTLKYLQGIAHRKWIVSYRWIEDCGRQQRLLDELPYEATSQDDVGTNGAGPRNSRLRDKGLFEGFTFLCVGPYDNVSPSQYQDLLLATGASVVDSFDVFAKMGGIKGIVIQENTHDDKAIKHWYRTAKAAPILVDWIVECIGHYKLFKLAPYIVYLSPQDFCAVGYPRELVEEDEGYSDDE